MIPSLCWRGVLADYRAAITGSTEAPEDYHFGCLLSVMGAAIGRGARIFSGMDLYPNQYTLLIGPTGDRKTTAMRHALSTVKDEWVPQLSRLSTSEGLVARLMRQEETSLVVAQEELTLLLAVARREVSASVVPSLIELYDNPEKYEVPTRANPLVAIRPTFTLLSGTQPERFYDHLEPWMITSGFLNRYCYYIGEKKPPIVKTPKPRLGPIMGHMERLVEPRIAGKPVRDITMTSAADKQWEVFYLRHHSLPPANDTLDEMRRR
jgi:hypothetical protein